MDRRRQRVVPVSAPLGPVTRFTVLATHVVVELTVELETVEGLKERFSVTMEEAIQMRDIMIRSARGAGGECLVDVLNFRQELSRMRREGFRLETPGGTP